jgi:hypothetical protein
MNAHIRGVLVRGHRVASEPSKDYPYGTLQKQKPFFKALGLDLSEYFDGTLNVSIAPLKFRMLRPQFTFERVAWTDLHPPETFSFSRCKVMFENAEYEGWVYYPHPETKKRHFQAPSLIEVIARQIPGIHYGSAVELEINPREILIERG